MKPYSGPVLRIVVPTLNEVRSLPHLLADLQALEVPHEIVVVDGGSSDGTAQVAREAGAEVRQAPAGRGRQLNRGAEGVSAPWLLFLHADCRVPPGTLQALREWLADPTDGAVAAYFRFLLDGDDWFWRFIEFGQRLREGMYGLVYGDQGLLVRSEGFQRIGGYPDQPLMEDVEIIRRLRAVGTVRPIAADLITSPRRYRSEGRWLGWLRNMTLMTLYLAGVPATRLARWYPAQSPPPRRSDRILLIFAKLPQAGRVKTRIARELGPEAAARIYARLGREVVDAVRNGPYRAVVCHDPPERSEEIAEWLGSEGLEFWPQLGSDLGARLRCAVDRAFTEAQAVCVIGTDAPDVDAALVDSAFLALKQSQVALGPAEDGGYYLLAMGRPCPDLFSDIPWSTEHVAATTRQRALEAGLQVVQLPTLSDVDKAADVPTRLRV